MIKRLVWCFGIAFLHLHQLVCVLSSSLPRAECVDYENHLPDGTLGFCAGLIPYKFYLPFNETQISLERIAYSLVIAEENPTSATLLSLLPNRCSSGLKRTLCAAVFQRCVEIDPFFLDTSCVPFGGVCQATGVCQGNPSVNCISGPGKTPGNGGNVLWPQNACSSINATYSTIHGTCVLSVPINPAKSLCDALHSTDKSLINNNLSIASICPVVSGLFSSLTSLPSTSDRIKADLNAQISASGCSSPLECAGTLFNVNLLGLLGILPDCDAQVDTIATFAEEYTLETASDRSSSIGKLVALKANSSTNCTSPAATVLQSCVNLAASVRANQDVSIPLMQPGLSFVEDFPIAPLKPNLEQDGTSTAQLDQSCAKVITDDANQPSNIGDLALLALSAGKLSPLSAKGAFIVPPTLGLPPLAHQFGFSGTSPSSPFSKFMTQTNQQSPLCVFQGKVGKNSLECLLLQISASISIVPRFVNPVCQAVLRDLTCQAGHLKPEIKRLCFVPDQLGGCASLDVSGASTNTMPFVFSIPRFPSKNLCIQARSACDSFFTFLKETNPIGFQALSTALDCDQNINITCASTSTFKSSVWPEESACVSPFNGIPRFAEGTETTLVNLSSIPGLLAYASILASNSFTLSTFASAGVSNNTSPTLVSSSLSEANSFCACPAPLIASGNFQDAICCADVCESSMFLPTDWTLFYNLIFWVSLASTGFSFFVVVTWATFKVKRQQRLTLFFSLSSCFLGLSFVIANNKPTYRDVWCKDAVTPNVQEDMGFCLFQAITLPLFTVSCCAWWWCQSFDLYMKIYRERRVSYMKFYVAISVGLPLVNTAIYLASNTLGYTSSNPWCFTSEEGISELEYYLFYGEILFFTATGLLMMLLVIYQIHKVTSAGAKMTTSKSALKRLETFRTPIFFVFFFLFVWFIIFSWRFQTIAQTSEIEEAGIAWSECLISNFASGIENPAEDPAANISSIIKWRDEPGCGSTFPLTVDRISLLLVLCVALLQGVFVFFIFAAKKEVLMLWAERLNLTSRKVDTTGGDKNSNSNKKANGDGGGSSLNLKSLPGTVKASNRGIASNDSSDYDNITTPTIMIDNVSSVLRFSVPWRKAPPPGTFSVSNPSAATGTPSVSTIYSASPPPVGLEGKFSV